MTTTTEERAAGELHNDVHWNLGDLFTGINDPRIDETLDRAQERAERFQADYKGKIDSPTLTAQTLGAAIREYEALYTESSKPGSFASLLFSTNTADPAIGAFLQKIRERGTQLSLPTLFFDLELAAVPEETLAPLLEACQGL